MESHQAQELKKEEQKLRQQPSLDLASLLEQKCKTMAIFKTSKLSNTSKTILPTIGEQTNLSKYYY